MILNCAGAPRDAKGVCLPATAWLVHHPQPQTQPQPQPQQHEAGGGPGTIVGFVVVGSCAPAIVRNVSDDGDGDGGGDVVCSESVLFVCKS